VIRLFAALELPDATRAALASWAARAVGRDPAVRLVPSESLHVTLVFLGSVDDDAAPAVGAAVVSAARPVGELRVTGAAWLPPRRPGVLVADLAAEPSLSALHAAVVSALAPWHEPEPRPFRPHVTVARVRHHERIRARDVVGPPALSFAPAALVLYRSHMGPGGSTYEAIARAAL
jgi:2'-5' RNA ligase